MDQFKPKHWYIIGAGAIGCLWACALRDAGCRVTLLVKSQGNYDSSNRDHKVEYSSLFNKKGKLKFTIEILNREQLLRENRVISHLIIATKAQDALGALNHILSQLSHSAKVMCLSNGLGIHKELLTALRYHQTDRESVLSSEKNSRLLLQGVTSDGARLDQAFKVKHTGQGRTYIGNYEVGKLSAKGSSIQPLQQVAGFKLTNLFLKTSIVNNIEERIWHKALVNCVINPLTAFYQCTNGELFNNTERQTKIHMLCEELAGIINQTQCPISTTSAKIINDTKKISLLTEKNTSSMLTDLKKGRKLELEHLNQYFIRRAQKYSVPCPVNLDLVNTLIRTSK